MAMWLATIFFFTGVIGFITPAMAELYRWVDEQGQVRLSDTPPSHTKEFKVYKARQGAGEEGENRDNPRSQAGSAASGAADLQKPPHMVQGLQVKALLNRRLTVPLILDTGASYTVLTKQTAQDLRLTISQDTPRLKFLTAGGAILSPVTRLRSIRIGTAEVQDVDAAIDVDGRLPLGLLGMSFMRHFKVTVDQGKGQVRFER